MEFGEDQFWLVLVLVFVFVAWRVEPGGIAADMVGTRRRKTRNLNIILFLVSV